MTGDFVPRSTTFCINGGCHNKTNDFCSTCGFNAREAEKRKELPLVKLQDGRRGKLVRKQRLPDSYRRRVIRIDADGNEVEYPSVKAAADDVKGFPTNISNACRENDKTAYGYAWRYADQEPDGNEEKDNE